MRICSPGQYFDVWINRWMSMIFTARRPTKNGNMEQLKRSGQSRCLSLQPSVSFHTRDSPILVSPAAEAYKPSDEPHFLYLRHLNLHQLCPHILKPNYMPNTALFMHLSSSILKIRQVSGKSWRISKNRMPPPGKWVCAQAFAT
jgi:hypothetical protein